MADSVQRIADELRSIGYEPTVLASPHGTVVSFQYTVEAGSHEGTAYTIGFSLQGAEHYPEYPPHWIHISPPLDDGKGGVVHGYRDTENREWTALSRPPLDFWDQLPTKHMRAYMGRTTFAGFGQTYDL